jgi:hypothetical protein
MQRWMGNQQLSARHKSFGKSVPSTESVMPKSDLDQDPHSTATIVRQLLNPTVSENEEAEYHGFVFWRCVDQFSSLCIFLMIRYIDQCQDLLDAPMNSGERKDFEVYLRALMTATGGDMARLDDVPDEAFLVYVERGTAESLDGWGRKEGALSQFNYERWLGTQRF